MTRDLRSPIGRRQRDLSPRLPDRIDQIDPIDWIDPIDPIDRIGPIDRIDPIDWIGASEKIASLWG